MILNTFLTVLTIFHTLISILLPASHMHDMLTSHHYHLTRLDILTTVVADTTCHTFFSYIRLVVFMCEGLRLDKGDKHIHDEEEDGEG